MVSSKDLSTVSRGPWLRVNINTNGLFLHSHAISIEKKKTYVAIVTQHNANKIPTLHSCISILRDSVSLSPSVPTPCPDSGGRASRSELSPAMICHWVATASSNRRMCLHTRDMSWRTLIGRKVQGHCECTMYRVSRYLAPPIHSITGQCQTPNLYIILIPHQFQIYMQDFRSPS